MVYLPDLGIYVPVNDEKEEKVPEERPCDGNHCRGCYHSGLCDLQDSFEND